MWFKQRTKKRETNKLFQVESHELFYFSQLNAATKEEKVVNALFVNNKGFMHPRKFKCESLQLIKSLFRRAERYVIDFKVIHLHPLALTR